MANIMWFYMYPTSRCHYLDYEVSDPRPLLSEFQPEKKKKRCIFRYDRAMRHKSKISKLIKVTWNKFEGDLVETHIANCRKPISGWSRKHHMNNRKTIDEEFKKRNLKQQ